MIKKFNLHKKNDGQMILLAGITISILIILLVTISMYLANIEVSLSFDKNIDPLGEYINVREVFIKVFNNSCAGYNDTDTIYYAFNHTKRNMFEIEMKYGNYFDAQIIKITNLKTNYLNVTVNLELICKQTTIEERINVPVWVST